MHAARLIGKDIPSLTIALDPIPSHLPLEELADLFRHPAYAEVLSIPVVDDGKPVGMISRHRFTDIYLKRYGRELYGKQPVGNFANKSPLTVAYEQPLAEAAQHITGNMQLPLTEDFIITRNGKYLGIGFVMDLIKAMEMQMRADTEALDQAYSRLKSSQTALVQSEKMASLGQMVAGVAHEINTPLGYVQNNVTIGNELFGHVQNMFASYETLVDKMLDGQSSAEEVSAQIQQIAEMRAALSVNEMLGEMRGLMEDSLYGIGQISELVLNLKNFSRMDSAATDTVSLHDCIASALNIGRNILKNKVEIVRQFGDIPAIKCAPSQLNQVFLNLFTNAAQAIADHGRITIKTWHVNDAVHIEVADTGKGIPAENIARIFDPFFTTKAIGEGTGLGLSITYQIIQQHGGDIRVTSRVGEGTCFHIRLPASAAHHDAQLLAA
ncbi:MAG: ATP-binding protein [Sideroxydans sp.]|nr:ATP-binding protein [Sideroxydans sp.]